MTMNDWLDAYGASHRNPVNIAIHKLCVPAIMFTVLGFFWCIPVPSTLAAIPFANAGTLVALLGLMFYLRLSLSMAIGMAAMSAVCLIVLGAMQAAHLPVLAICAAVFVLAWIAQFYGHKVEGKKPSFFRDLQFLLIGPAWTLSWLYRRFGIRI